jgi:polyphosphate kinase 2
MAAMSTPPVPTRIDEMEQGPPHGEKISKKVYKKELEGLQIELLKAQRSVKESGDRIVILFEGRDAAGKGGSIKRITEHMNPRGGRVVALSKPTDTERTQWYFQRYVAHLPSAGEIVLFDRSWYNRAGVEQVMGFCTAREHAQFLRQVPAFESALVSSGIQLFKLWFTVSREQQRERFDSRRSDPLRQWKLSPIDEASIDRFDDYTARRNEMLLATDTALAPWTIINSNEKQRARLGSLHAILNTISYVNKDNVVASAPDARVVRPANSMTIEG